MEVDHNISQADHDKDKIPGIGQKTRDNFRKQLGIDELMVLSPTVDEYLYEKLQKEKGL